MGDEPTVDRNDPELKYLTVEKNQFNDPATQAEWTQKRLVWVPHESQVRTLLFKKNNKENSRMPSDRILVTYMAKQQNKQSNINRINMLSTNNEKRVKMYNVYQY